MVNRATGRRVEDRDEECWGYVGSEYAEQTLEYTLEHRDASGCRGALVPEPATGVVLAKINIHYPQGRWPLGVAPLHFHEGETT